MKVFVPPLKWDCFPLTLPKPEKADESQMKWSRIAGVLSNRTRAHLVHQEQDHISTTTTTTTSAVIIILVMLQEKKQKSTTS